MKIILTKLSSRKLWATIAGIAIGVAVIFGVDEGVLSTISGAMTSMLSVVAYIITEGKIDAAGVGQMVKSVGTIVDSVEMEGEEE